MHYKAAPKLFQTVWYWTFRPKGVLKPQRQDSQDVGKVSGLVWSECGTCPQSLWLKPGRSEILSRPGSAGTGDSAAAPEANRTHGSVWVNMKLLSIHASAVHFSKRKPALNVQFSSGQHRNITVYCALTLGSWSHCSLFFISSWISWMRFRDSKLSSSRNVVSLINMLM